MKSGSHLGPVLFSSWSNMVLLFRPGPLLYARAPDTPRLMLLTGLAAESLEEPIVDLANWGGGGAAAPGLGPLVGEPSPSHAY